MFERMNKSKERAKEIINIHLKNITSLAKSCVNSIILVGSLSDDSYTGNAGSDIDLIHILKKNSSSFDRDKILKIIDKSENDTNKDIPISKCVYHYEDLFRPYNTEFELCLKNKDYMELPIEVLRVKDSGIVIWGENEIDSLNTPTKEDVIKFNKISQRWTKIVEKENPKFYEEYKKMIDAPTIRILVQMIITKAMLQYYFATGESCSSKKQINVKMKENVAKYRFQKLLDLCVKWRYTPNEITRSDEEYMMNNYKEWKLAHENKECDYIPLLDESI